MNDELPEALCRHLADLVQLPHRPEANVAVRSRAGGLHRLQFGDQLFALKLYGDDGYHNDTYFFDALASTTVPVPRIHARDDSCGLVDQPWVLMDWLDGDQRITSDHHLGEQLGLILKQIHAVPVAGAGGRSAGGWQFASWHDLVALDTPRDREKVAALEDSDENRRLYLAIVDEFARVARQQPSGASLLHGDLGLDNMVIDDNRVVGLIDSGWFVGGHPLLDVAYLMNHRRLGAGEAKRGFFAGYGATDMDGGHDLLVFRLYHLVGKLLHSAAVGARERYHQRRGLVRDLAAQTRGLAPMAVTS